MIQRSFFILCFYLLTFVANSQTVKLDLFRCIEIASDSSLQAFRSKNMYQSSYWEYRGYKSRRLPSVNLELTPMQYNRNIIKRYDFNDNIDIYRSQQSLYSSGGLNISQNFDLTGGTFFLDSDLGYMRNYGENTYSQFTTVPLRIGYSQALFGFNAFKWEKKIEPLKFEQAKKRLLFNMEEISENAAYYFFNFAQAQSEYQMAWDNVLSTDTLYKVGQERRKISAISEADILTLELDVINADNTLKNVMLNLKTARFNLVSFLKLDDSINIMADLPQKNMHIEILISEAINYMKENNPDYMVNRREILEAEKELDRNNKSTSFEANISASIGFNQVANNFTDAYKKPLQQDIASITLTIPILDWGVRKGRVNMARNSLNVAKIAIQEKEQTLEQEIVASIDNFNTQNELIKSAERAIFLANSAYNETKQRFIMGRSDINSLTLSLNRKKEAQRNYINTLKNYWLSYFKIRKLTLYDFEKQEHISNLTDKRIFKL